MKLPAPVSFAVGLVPALAAGWLLFPRLLYKTEAQPLPFNHKVHTEGGMGCTDCHATAENGRFTGLPTTEACAGCHAEKGDNAGINALVASYVEPGREVPWLVHARQPDNVYFPHAPHVTGDKLACARCHGPHGASTATRTYAVNRLSGYSRDIWGPSLARVGPKDGQGMKMSDCIQCHRAGGRESACLDCHK
ncbi:MAG: cytochrome c3 family protein [Holophagales bacterium]|nr:cytochrome c3 family protein [Holophagales bacterium]